MKTSILNLALFLLLLAPPLAAAATPELPSSPPAISGGAEARFLATRSPVVPDAPPVSPLAPIFPGAGFDAFGFNDNAAVNGGFLFIPPDPIGAAGVDRLIAVVNAGIEARTKTGTLLFRSSLQGFFSAAAGNLGSFCFDPKIVYDHHADRFVVIALEQWDQGSGDPSDESRILMAVSRTPTPATATAADWYYQVIDAKQTIGSGPCWADYPGLEVDEEAVYITVNYFPFSTSAGSFGARLWIVDKGLGGGFYAGGPAARTVHNAYVGPVAGFETTTMPCEVLQPGGVGPGIGTYLLSYSGLTYGGPGNPEALIVIRVDNPLGAVTFTPEFVNLLDIEDVGGVFGWPALPDAPQAGGAALIEVNDRRALDAVWRNGFIYLATTIIPNASDPANAGQTTAHWIRLDATAVASSASPAGLVVLDQEGNVGGEDIAPGTYTFFPGIAVNGADELKIGFAASAPSIFAGAYVAGRVPADAPGTVGPSGTVRAGIDYYYRAFGGSRNRWGDYSGVAIDPADDSQFWIYNQWADLRGTPISGEDGRWGTAWLQCSFSPVGADLVVSAFDAPCCVYEGQQVGSQLFVEVTNVGSGASVNCQLGLYLSPDAVIDPGDLPLVNGVLGVPPLGPGASTVLAVPANVEIPVGAVFGPQFLGALVDDGNLVPETDEGNNSAATDAMVNPDLFGCAGGEASSLLAGDVSVYVVPDGSGNPLSAAQQFTGVGSAPATVDATITAALRDGQGAPLPGQVLSLASSAGNLTLCAGAVVVDGPTDGVGVATFSGPLSGGGTAALGEVLLVVGGGQQPIPGMIYGAARMLGGSADGAVYDVSLATGLATPLCPGFFNPNGSTEIEYDPVSGTGWSAAPEFYKEINTFDFMGCAVVGGPWTTFNYGFNGLEWIDGALFGTGIPTSCDPSILVRMDPPSGTQVFIGPTGLGPVSGLAWDPACRRLYGVTGCYNLFGNSDLVLIDLDTGAATLIGDTGVPLGSLEMGPDGRLYAGSASIDGRNLYVLDKATGQATLVGPTNMSASVSGLALVSDAGIPLRFNSPDLTGDLRVDISDAGAFTAFYYNGTYDYDIDFRFDGVENVSDAGFMANSIGATCAAPAPEVAAVAPGQALFRLEVVGADAQGLLRLAAGEAGTARLLVDGELARAGVRAWEGRFEASDNLVIDAVDPAGPGLDLGTGGDHVVAFAQPLRSETGAVQVATVRFHVTDDGAASLRLEATSGSSVGGTAPAVLSAAVREPVAVDVRRYRDGSAAVINAVPEQAVPATLALDLRPVPNPFNPRTEIRFNLPRSGQVDVLVYDVRGRLVWSAGTGELAAGAQAVAWDGLDRQGQAVTSGVYFYQLVLDGQKLGAPGKMTLLR